MGLDIYFYRAKSKKDAERYLQVADAYDAFSAVINTKYQTQIQEANAKFEAWHAEEIAKTAKDENYEINYDNAPHADISTYASKEDTETYQQLHDEYTTLQNELHFDYDDDIDDLYMRKKNWMVYFVQKRHPERMIEDENYGKILKGAIAVLDKNDIQQLVDNMRAVIKDFADYETATGKKMYKKDGWITNAASQWVDKWLPTAAQKQVANDKLPTMSRFFFGSTDYDYWYFSDIKYYLSEFEKLLNDMSDDEALLYSESW